MLKAEALSKHYNGTPALSDLDLEVNPGDIYCLLGANGAGKSTTIRLFLNFISATSGRALVNGMEVSAEPLETKKYLAYIPEQVMLYPHLTGAENLEYFAALSGHDDYDRGRIEEFLTRSGLQKDAHHERVGTYSKGMRQKVGIAVALAKQAGALLLDEPTSGLDPEASNEFSLLLRQLRDDGVAILMATHDLFRAKEVGSRVGIMRRGVLRAELDPAELGHADLERIYLEHMHD
ncbi:MAG: ABC transporter ATP-binding protein [Gemmatimonadales bacterium]|nr:MAG: ABC transporter ATP-binding protein [Gemmatimonadales bacterium]